MEFLYNTPHEKKKYQELEGDNIVALNWGVNIDQAKKDIEMLKE